MGTIYHNDIEYGGGAEYTLPVASQNNLGGIKVGENLSIDANGVLSASGGGGSSATFYSQTLTAGQTSVTFTGLPTTDNYIADFYTSNGADYISLDTSTSGQVTVTYVAQSSNITVYMRLEEITL